MHAYAKTLAGVQSKVDEYHYTFQRPIMLSEYACEVRFRATRFVARAARTAMEARAARVGNEWAREKKWRERS